MLAPARRVAGHRASTSILRLGRTRPDDEHEPFGVTQFALRASRAANGVSQRHGGVSREMWQALWPDRAVDDVPIGHVTNGVHVPSWVGAPMRAPARPPPRRGLAAARGATRRRSRRSTRSRTRSCGRCAASSAGLLVDYVRDRSQLRPDRARRPARLRRGRGAGVRPGRPDDRLRAAAGDVQAPAPAAARRRSAASRCCAASARSSCCIAGKAHPRDDDGKRLVQDAVRRALAAARRSSASSSSRTTTSASAARLVARLRRVGQRAAAAAGGQRDERHEGGRQRRAAAQRARRLVGRGLRRRQRLGAVGRGRPRPRPPRTPATPTSSTGCSRARSSPSSTSATAPASRRRGCARIKRSMQHAHPRVLGDADARRVRAARLPRG